MKSEQAVLEQIDSYKRQLALAVTEKTLALISDPQLDLLILTLVDKLEALFWVLDVELESSETQPLIN